MIREANEGGNVQINYEELAKEVLLASSLPEAGGKAKSTGTDEGLIENFKALDHDGRGFMTAGELRHVMTDRGEKLTYEEADEAIRDADVDGDDQIYY